MSDSSTISAFQEAIHRFMIVSETRETLWFMDHSSRGEVLQVCLIASCCFGWYWSAVLMNSSRYQFFEECRISLWCMCNNCNIRRKKQRERRNPDNWYCFWRLPVAITYI